MVSPPAACRFPQSVERKRSAASGPRMLAERDPHHIPVRCHRPARQLAGPPAHTSLRASVARGPGACRLPTARLSLPQGYTGYLPGVSNHFAKTYGQVSKAALAERQANDDPLKWRKILSEASLSCLWSF